MRVSALILISLVEGRGNVEYNPFSGPIKSTEMDTDLDGPSTQSNDRSNSIASTTSYSFRVLNQLNNQIKQFERQAQKDGKLPGDPAVPMRQLGPHGPGLRALLAPQMGLVNEYGCWCYFEDSVGQGAGEPQDRLDEICKTLHNGYECIIMDHLELNDPCVPWEVPYNSAFGSGTTPFGLTLENLKAECELQNPDGSSCAQKTCMVEGWFVLSYFTYSIFGGGINSELQHLNGFDPVETCGAKDLTPTEAPPVEEPVEEPPIENPGDDTGEEEPECTEGVDCPIEETKECCGPYPERFPYKRNVEHQCCVFSTYNPNMFLCCSDGQVLLACP